MSVNLYDLAPVGYVTVSAQGLILEANRTAAALLGVDRGALIEQPISRSILEKDHDAYYRYRKELLESDGAQACELRMVKKDGAAFWVRLDAAATRDESGAEVCRIVMRDLTERIRLEKELQDRTRLFNLITEYMTDYVTIFDLDLKTVRYVTPSFTRASGYTLEEINELPLDRKMTKPSYERVMKIVEEELSPEKLADPQCDIFIETDIEFVPKCGKPAWYNCTYRLIRDADGRPECFLETGRNIAERKRVEDALKESEERHRILFFQSKDAVMTLAPPSWRFTSGNPAIVDMFGAKDIDEFTSLPPWGLSPERQPDGQRSFDKAKRMIETAMREGFHHFEWMHRRLDGTDFPARVTLSRMQVAGQTFLHAVVRDITQQKRAEEAMKVFKEALETSTDAIGMSTPLGRHYYQNGAFDRLFGSIGEYPPDTLYVDKQVGEVVFGTIRSGGQWTGEVKMYAADGRILDIHLRAYANKDENGNIVSLVGIHNDITQRKRTEAALKKAHDDLERRVKERTAELSAANAQLRRERQTLEHMLRASDHERQLIAYDIHDGLAQELAGAIMQFQLYEQQKDTQPQDARKAFDGGVALLRQGHSEARRLISGVRPPILDESGVVAAIAHLVHDPAFEHGPKVEFRSRVTFSRLAPVAENVIYRIVQEALSNARQHSQSTRIVVSIVQRGDRLRIEIRDEGVGFDPQNVSENRFGLEGIRERARLMGGKCSIRSKPGGGTAVIVQLPLAPQTQAGSGVLGADPEHQRQTSTSGG